MFRYHVSDEVTSETARQSTRNDPREEGRYASPYGR